MSEYSGWVRLSEVPKNDPEAIAEIFGPKAGGLQHLSQHAVSPDGTAMYRVPDTFTSPTTGGGRDDSSVQRAMFDALLAGLPGRVGALIVRSSARREKPGEHESPLVVVSPGTEDRAFAEFQKTIGQVGEMNPHMGLVVQPVVGNKGGFVSGEKSGEKNFGLRTVSFVGDSHGLRNDNMVFQVVTGLNPTTGSPLVQPILLEVNRKTGKTTRVMNGSDSFIINQNLLDWFVLTPEAYRQMMALYLNLEKGEVDFHAWPRGPESSILPPTGVLNLAYINSDGRLQMVPVMQILTSGMDLESWQAFSGARLVGLIPFTKIEQFDRMQAAVRYLAGLSTLLPFQVEGAYPDLSASRDLPYLYQYLPLPSRPLTNRQITITNPDLTSDAVHGIGRYSGPVLRFKFKPAPGNIALSTVVGTIGNYLDDALLEVDPRLRETGYGVVANILPAGLIQGMPNARYVLSGNGEFPGGHVETAHRIERAEGGQGVRAVDMVGAMPSEMPSFLSEELTRLASIIGLEVSVGTADIESNGEKVALKWARNSHGSVGGIDLTGVSSGSSGGTSEHPQGRAHAGARYGRVHYGLRTGFSRFVGSRAGLAV